MIVPCAKEAGDLLRSRYATCTETFYEQRGPDREGLLSGIRRCRRAKNPVACFAALALAFGENVIENEIRAAEERRQCERDADAKLDSDREACIARKLANNCGNG